jgi:photosystem II stability/assembly factor-like uncharacterized protein
MTTLYVAMEDALLVVRQRAGGWTAEEYLAGRPVQCAAADPGHRDRIYVGAADGLWRSADGGRTWASTDHGVAGKDVTAVAVGGRRAGRPGTVYAGTEPSAIFKSEDGGDTWTELKGLLGLPSAKSWSFPPRPDTHHVRSIAVDPHAPPRLYVAIEAGALVRSQDGGETWLDRVPTGPYDTHTLVLHHRAPGRLYSAAGDGYFESRDGGDTWEEIESGLRHLYLFGVAVDPAEPEGVVVSAASGPGTAYSASRASTYVYSRSGRNAWTVVQGLPDPKGTTITVLATHREKPHAIYGVNNRGIFVSQDAGARWAPLDIPWPQRFLRQSAQGLVVAA